jgi:hypothetical protein
VATNRQNCALPHLGLHIGINCRSGNPTAKSAWGIALPDRRAGQGTSSARLRAYASAGLLIAAVGVALYLSSTVSKGSSSDTPPVTVVDSHDIATRIAATASVPGRTPDKVQGSVLTASGRTSLGICVEDTTGAFAESGQIVGALTESIADLQKSPKWSATSQTGDPPVVATSCPLPPSAQSQGIRNNRGKVTASVSPSSVASPFNIFVFVIAPEVVQRDFVGDSPNARILSQETLCNSGDSPCFVVSYGIYLTPNEFRDRSLREQLFSRAVGFQPPPTAQASLSSNIGYVPVRSSPVASPTTAVPVTPTAIAPAEATAVVP